MREVGHFGALTPVLTTGIQTPDTKRVRHENGAADHGSPADPVEVRPPLFPKSRSRSSQAQVGHAPTPVEAWTILAPIMAFPARKCDRGRE
jgi:hypothetical protein